MVLNNTLGANKMPDVAVTSKQRKKRKLKNVSDEDSELSSDGSTSDDESDGEDLNNEAEFCAKRSRRRNNAQGPIFCLLYCKLHN